MLKLKRLSLNNFGPFKGRQQIDFPSQQGAVVIYGENGRGKTSLLNAIRYAFFGKVLGRSSVPVTIDKLGNWDSAEEGNHEFGVELEFSYGDTDYHLNRICKLRTGVDTPMSEADFSQESFLRKDKKILGPDEKDVELSRIIPEQVSRFFLFDGELLQEYEQLLIEESETGQKIKEAIERILGVPVLTGSKRILDSLLREAREAESKAAQKDKNTKALGDSLDHQITLKRFNSEEREKTKIDIDQNREKKGRIDEQRRKFDRVAKLIHEEEELDKAVHALGDALKDNQEALQQASRNAWKALLAPKVKETKDLTETKIAVLQTQSKRFNLDALREALKVKSCPVCSSSLDDGKLETLEKHLAGQDKDKIAHEEETLQELYTVIKPLRSFDQGGSREVLDLITSRLDDIKIEIAHKRDRLAEIEESIKGFDAKEIRELNLENEAIVRDLALLDNKLVAIDRQIAENDSNILRIEETLDKDAGARLLGERSRRELVSQLLDLFESGVHSYREKLRKRVEGDATTLFKKFSSDPDYKKLEINSNYGLSIIHQDGKRIPIRSAGFEHIVALSLMGALQKNAPLSGPIIMDSPFGRLDGAHTRNVTKALPDMAHQIMLLVYEEELAPELAREVLAGKLRAEYRMVRKGSRFTELRKEVGK